MKGLRPFRWLQLIGMLPAGAFVFFPGGLAGTRPMMALENFEKHPRPILKYDNFFNTPWSRLLFPRKPRTMVHDGIHNPVRSIFRPRLSDISDGPGPLEFAREAPFKNAGSRDGS